MKKKVISTILALTMSLTAALPVMAEPEFVISEESTGEEAGEVSLSEENREESESVTEADAQEETLLGARIVEEGPYVNTASNAITYSVLEEDGKYSLRLSGSGFMSYNAAGPAYKKYPIEEVQIDAGITNIGMQAFSEMEDLKKVSIPASVTTIYTEAFKGCTSLEEITLPEKLTSVAMSAFENCTSLSSVKIPDSVTSIGADTFLGCSALIEVGLPKNLKLLPARIFKNTPIRQIELPKTLTEIGSEAFSYCEKLESIRLPEKLEIIGSNAFQSSGLTEITIPASVSVIGSNAFGYCASLEKVVLADGVKEIGDRAFISAAVNDLWIPKSVDSMGISILAWNANEYKESGQVTVRYEGTEEEWKELTKDITPSQSFGGDILGLQHDPIYLFYGLLGIGVKEDVISVGLGKLAVIPVVLTPEYAMMPELIWTSQDKDVAVVDSKGTVSGMSAGQTVITAETKDGQFSCQVKVVVGCEVMYRMYNPNSGEHFYTAVEAEKDSLIKAGWSYEGIGWFAPSLSRTPVYRLYNENAGDHHYTMNISEMNALVKLGWKYEGIGWYSDDLKRVPLYRQYNPNAAAGSHNYTESKGENDWLVTLGWKAEGIGWYGSIKA